MESIAQKRCSKCDLIKDAGDFYPDKTKKYGLSSRCKQCVIEATRQNSKENTETRIARVREYQNSATPEQKREWQDRRNAKRRAKRAAFVGPRHPGNRYAPSEYVTPEGRICSTCGVIKSADEFGVDKKAVDELRSICKACRRIQREANANANRERHRRYRMTVLKARKDSDPEAFRAKIRKLNNASYWRKPDEYRARVNRRNAKKKANGGSFTADEWDALCARYDYRCLCCGEKKPLTIDHIIPVTKGGTSDISNIQPLCRECNTRKYTKTIDYRVNNPFEVH